MTGAIYPYATSDRLKAANLNNDLELSNGLLPPAGSAGGAKKYKLWLDTSTTPATLRMCTVASATAGVYVAAEWTTVGYVDATNKVVGFDGMWTTGDVKVTLKAVADPGWVMFNDGTIGDASSGASARANADTVGLFTLLWNNTADADCAVSTGRGASAAADFAAHKTIALPKVLGRALAAAGAGSGLTSRALAHVVGEENHALTVGELAAHAHTIQSANVAVGSDSQVVTAASSGVANNTPTTTNAGSGTAHNTMQPTTFFNIMVKL